MIWNSEKDAIETDYYLLRDDEHGEEKEYKLLIKAAYYSSERSFFNPMTGDGHPGSPADMEITSVTLEGKDFELSAEENSKLEEFLWDHIGDNDPDEDDDFNIEDELERREEERLDQEDRDRDDF